LTTVVKIITDHSFLLPSAGQFRPTRTLSIRNRRTHAVTFFIGKGKYIVPAFALNRLFTLNSDMGEKRLNFLCPKKTHRSFTSETVDIMMNLLTMGLLCAIGVVVIYIRSSRTWYLNVPEV